MDKDFTDKLQDLAHTLASRRTPRKIVGSFCARVVHKVGRASGELAILPGKVFDRNGAISQAYEEARNQSISPRDNYLKEMKKGRKHFQEGTLSQWEHRSPTDVEPLMALLISEGATPEEILAILPKKDKKSLPEVTA